MNYLKFEFDIENIEQQERLVALLADLSFEGFEEDENSLNAFIHEDKFNKDEFSSVIDMFESVSFIQTTIENINWNQKWEEDFKPVMVEEFVGIRAWFHQPIKNVAHEIIITPKMSFGTGHHATTYLMIKQMESISFNGKSVFDFGTGTGVLAILASKLGAEKVFAIDYDEWSITNAIENIEQNACSNITVEQMDTVPLDNKFDIILANINLNVILDNLASIKEVSAKGAIILLSGILKENESALLQPIQEIGLLYLSTFQRGDWIVVMLKMIQ